VQPLRPKAFATVVLNVPNERFVDNTKVTLEVPEAFLKAGGRLNRVQYPPGWTVTLEKKEKPTEIYQKEKDDRAKRDAKRQDSREHSAAAGQDDKEKQTMDELRRKWITKVTFEGGSIPPDGFQQFQISFQLPDDPGNYRFAAVQTYADGKDVSWSELVEGAEHPAASLNVQNAPLISNSTLALGLAGLALLISMIGLLKRRSSSAPSGPVSANDPRFAGAGARQA